jgi:hypothetical protein
MTKRRYTCGKSDLVSEVDLEHGKGYKNHKQREFPKGIPQADGNATLPDSVQKDLTSLSCRNMPPSCKSIGGCVIYVKDLDTHLP